MDRTEFVAPGKNPLHAKRGPKPKNPEFLDYRDMAADMAVRFPFVPLKPPGIAMRDNLARARAYHAMPSWWGKR